MQNRIPSSSFEHTAIQVSIGSFCRRIAKRQGRANHALEIMRKQQLICILVCAGFCLAPVEPLLADGSTVYTINFDELATGWPTPPVPDNYYGFSWNNWDVIDGFDYVGGYEAGVVSRNNVIFALYGAPSSITRTEDFDFTSAYMTAAWVNGLQLEVKGLRDASVLYDNVYTLSSSGPTLLNFGYFGVNEVDFQVVSSQSQYVMDNLVVGIPVPEPSTLFLSFGSLSLCLLSICKKPKSRLRRESVKKISAL